MALGTCRSNRYYTKGTFAYFGCFRGGPGGKTKAWPGVAVTKSGLGGGDDAGFEGVLDEGGGVVAELEERRVIDVNHVTGFVESHPHVVAYRRVELHGVQGALGCVIGCGKVVVAAANPEFQIGIATHRLLQIFGDIEILVLRDIRVVPWADVGDHFVG